MPELNPASVPNEDRPLTEELEIPADKSVPEDAEAAEAGDDEHDEQAASSDEQPADGKPRSGYQRTKLKLAKARQETEFWRAEALRQRGTDGTKAKETVPAADEEPKPPNFATYTGTVEQFQKEVDAYPQKHREYIERDLQKQQMAKEVSRQADSYKERLNALPEFEQITDAAALFQQELLDHVEQIALRLKNGPEVVRALLLDPDEREQLAQFDRFKDGQGIGLRMMALSRELIANKKSAGAADAPTTRAPKPPEPVTKPSGKKVDDIYDPNLPWKDFVRLRREQIAKG